MSGEYQEAPAPVFRRIELSQLNTLEDLKPQALAFKENLGVEIGRIEQSKVKIPKSVVV